jgi:isoquinoline 1-oxidoreductase subunit alpha
VAAPDNPVIHFSVNGVAREFDGPGDVPLLWVVREELGLTGSKFGCGIGACGACTMHLDGQATRTCVFPMAAVAGHDVVTIEGLSKDRSHPAQRAWIALDVPQCGYCQSGMLMAVSALLAQTPAPTDAQIDDTITNLCRCATNARVRAGIHAAAKERA